ncbi:NADH-quinone oxidoreductase subunit NuoI [Helicobacter labetoulli]|uniref:NADH-quinone oxidoreductase subunit NuoI n=1 Tax=Helicobacter labetoulli TaxID=2315333 RepID=UPI000EF657DA|nr:NADH-quinone oxidoreductase subunit NuoI [Helicobacter labetoulli]
MKTEYRILPPRTKREREPFLTRVALTLKMSFSLDLLSGLKTALGAFFAPNVTVQYPLESNPLSPRYRAIHKLQRLLESENERCIGCGLCEKICTSNCIRIITDRGEDGRKKILDYSINFGRCIYCGLCAEVCPELAIIHGNRFENASVQRAHFGFKPELLESQSSLIEYGGFGSVSYNANERMIKTPLSYVLDSTKQETQESTQASTQPSQTQPSQKESSNV